jgi:hypothetical protein
MSKYKKSPKLKESYERLKQKMTHEPTETEVQQWEYEGGASPDEVNQVHAHALSFSEKVKFYAERFWRLFHKPHFT